MERNRVSNVNPAPLGPTGSFSRFSSEITDHTGPKKALKPCWHRKKHESGNNRVTFTTYSPEGGPFFGNYASGAAAPAWDECPVPEIDWASALHQLYMDAYGMFPTSTSLAVNIAELASIRSLAEGAVSTLRRLTKRQLGFTMKQVAGAHLAVEFGLLPLVSDMRELFSVSHRVKEKLRIMHEVQGERYRVRARTPAVHAEKTWEAKDIVCPGTNRSVSEDGVYTIKRDAYGCVSALCQRRLEPKEANAVRLTIAALGVTNFPAIAWELVPFSFVLDWLFPIGATINRAIEQSRSFRDLNASATQVVLTNSIHSYLEESEITWRATKLYPTWWWKKFTPTSKSSFCHTMSIYDRHIGFPANSGPQSVPGFNLHRALLGGSMLIQKI